MSLKRKRSNVTSSTSTSTLTHTTDNLSKLAVSPATSTSSSSSSSSSSFQIIVGTYDRILHGIRVHVPLNASDLAQSQLQLAQASSNSSASLTSANLPATFQDLYLFQAHTSSVRCIAVSPASGANSTKKRLLATASPDTKINLYHLHTRRSLGNLTPPNSATTTVLNFASSKTLLSGDEEGCIHIWRSRDWSLLTTLKTPAPKIHKRAGVEALGGINDIAVHPSGKIALSVARNERVVRLWNLMTGRKAGVMAFGKDTVPRSMTMGGSGEGVKVRWSSGEGEDAGYAVAFDRGVIVFGMDARPKFHIQPSPPSKIHQIQFFKSSSYSKELLLVSTEDGRVLIFSLSVPSSTSTALATISESEPESTSVSPLLLGTVGGKFAAMTTRIKDFSILELSPSSDATTSETSKSRTILTTACSDGMVRIWELSLPTSSSENTTTALILTQTPTSMESPKKKIKSTEPNDQQKEKVNGHSDNHKDDDDMQIELADESLKQLQQAEEAPDMSIGTLVGFVETGRRITCMTTVDVQDMIGRGNEDEQEEEDGEQESDSDNSDDE